MQTLILEIDKTGSSSSPLAILIIGDIFGIGEQVMQVYSLLAEASSPELLITLADDLFLHC